MRGFELRCAGALSHRCFESKRVLGAEQLAANRQRAGCFPGTGWAVEKHVRHVGGFQGFFESADHLFLMRDIRDDSRAAVLVWWEFRVSCVSRGGIELGTWVCVVCLRHPMCQPRARDPFHRGRQCQSSCGSADLGDLKNATTEWRFRSVGRTRIARESGCTSTTTLV